MPLARFVSRFAPSPTGFLHLGHAYSARLAWRRTREAGGRFLLRIEDIDAGRCRPEFEEQILDDLSWLGLDWDGPVRRQSEHFSDYAAALDRLEAAGVLYPCFCTRAEIRAEIERSKSAPHGPDGFLYPGTCRHLARSERAARLAKGEAYARRLDLGRAVAVLESRGRWPLYWTDAERGKILARPEQLGDVVLARKDIPTSYHLAVTIDDDIQGVTTVIRGRDLSHTTHIHRLIQALLDIAAPTYLHHRLIVDTHGKRLAKRHGALTIKSMREQGVGRSEILAKLDAGEPFASGR